MDAAGAPLRNVHKLESVIRIPIVLGIAQLLGRVPLPGTAPTAQWVHAFAHPERDKRVAATVVLLIALTVSTSLAWTARLAPPGTFSAIPRYWHDAADWLSAHNTGTPTPGRVLVVPGAPFATQTWGTTHDEPLQVFGSSPWGVRDSIPLTPPQTIRALDSVQRLFAAGIPSAGLADTLAHQGISYVVVRNDLDPESSRSARPILVHRAIEGSPRLEKAAQFGEPVGPGTLPGFVADSGLRPRYPALEIYRVIYRVGFPGDGAGNPGAPYFTDVDRLARVDGGPEVLLRLDERRRLLGQPPLGPVLMTADARAAGLPAPVVTVTDTPVARETDYGRVDEHSSAIRADGDTRHTFNRVPDYPVPGADPVYGRLERRADQRVEFVVGLHRDARRRSGDLARRRDRRRPGNGVGDQRPASRSRAMAAGQFRSPGDQRGDHPDTQRDRRRFPGPAHRDRYRHRQHHAAVRPAR